MRHSAAAISLFCFLFFHPDLHSAQHIILVHGLGRSTLSMHFLGKYLEKEGFVVHNFGYNSTSDSIPVFSISLLREVWKYGRTDTLFFVTHSMGGIVVRHLLTRLARTQLPCTILRVVMLAPPNRGSPWADVFVKNPVANFLLGPSLAMLTADTHSFVNRLGPVPFATGVIAGEYDAKVPPAQAHCPGEKGFFIAPCGHTFIMDNDFVRKKTLLFLKTGQF
ncbi:MAG: hypothetical protein A2487_06330 [Candidatus Raymondbacteria bacterium RifOxyC12_full_50_8]|uniref:DUF676 domain-containing protein n=1 Tax=Candidatus Raymondbacteria bacterium RIFOXYD12_FULL_49_13 TaxID=1817890 RepID=A0A1F7FC43_UNCRA|nr:MAG: hypothetical protein A2248_03230 [Candidatus Raymondbacteria bacterium RIFOXYA2_FULL_49_16]OGJ93289.1 MAG: hypothetical protein A2350_14565 [Candidatus Raymondbacteria bacterium RifOxyB12_full_50_8]OGK04249.1 MAG: hypothetical protein A2519_17975 [Candidatus Raymondbacteria bacterium RIFOXYD12_FULL_49_13]OGK06064.1 MAG: hypothetical protein A2487_06330 [Candidatus Raymondbacteria bacterium RifOxyC12_full_50_8]OGP42468.1 MAG: hypothetical protein A2324_17265 [Candidatus Raymondbacteria b